MGQRGPAQKDGPLHGHRPKDQSQVQNLTGDFPEGSASEQDIPSAPERWHAVAVHVYKSTVKSRQARYYEPSDYMVLFALCEQLSRCLKPRYAGIAQATGEAVYARQPMNGGEVTAVLKGLSNLGVTLADRRRLEIDIRQSQQSDKDDERAVTDINEYRERLQQRPA